MKETFRHIYAIAHQADWDNAVSRGEYKFLGANFTTGDQYDVVTRLKESDAEGIIRQVKEARRQADWVVVSVHSHEFGGQAVRNGGSGPT